jgi:hypothetical protein
MKKPDARVKTRSAKVASSRASRIKATTITAHARPPMSGHNSLMSAKGYYVPLLLMAAFSLWLRSGILVHALSNYIFDDEMFIRLARSLKAGAWLGPYDKFTLAKGMFYPLFICVASFATIPLKVAEQALYLAASALTAGLVRRRLGNNHLALVLFAVLAFNPVLWTVDLARVIREGLYVSLSLAVVALSVVISFPTEEQEREQEKDRHGRKILHGIGFGSIAGAFWLTREEGVWLLPAVAFVFAIAGIGILRRDWIPKSESGIFQRRSSHFKAIAMPFGVALIAFLATDGLVAGMNYRHYGVFETNEFKAKSFLRAYGALMRIRHDAWRRYIPFPKDARRHAYSVSPAARELAPFLDGTLGEEWRKETCKHVKITPCSEVSGGWFMWEFRDAVALAGQYGSAEEVLHFYDTLADEIDAACADGKIDCLFPRATMLPPFRTEYLWETFQSGEDVARVLFTMGGGVVGSAPSVGSSKDVNAFADLAGSVYPPSNLIIQGWAAAVSGEPTIQLHPPDSQSARASITLLPSQDVASTYPGFKTVRFRVETDCPVESCDLMVRETGGRTNLVPLEKALSGARFQGEGVRLTVETATVIDPLKSTAATRIRMKIVSIVAWVYAVAFPGLAVVGVAGLLLAASLRRAPRVPASVLALGFGSLAAVVVRIALLAYIDATSFPATSVLYVSPASPFVIIFAVVGVYSGYCVLANGNPGIVAGGQPIADSR